MRRTARPGIRSISAAGSVDRVSAFSVAAPKKCKSEHGEPLNPPAERKQKSSLKILHVFTHPDRISHSYIN